MKALNEVTIPNEFFYLEDKRFILSMDYATNHNFIGRPIAGYQSKACILTQPALKALIAVQDELDSLNKGYVLKIFDAYRPTTAVADFVQWSHDLADTKMKSIYYPTLAKQELFDLGYIFNQSSHSRGSTVDLTIAILDSKDHSKHSEMDMGTLFDFFDETSHTASTRVSKTAQDNRLFFKTIMEKHGFKNYPQEWWHFTLANEPFPDTYFAFPVQ